MFDFITGKFKGLNQVEEAANAFGMDMKHIRKEEAIREQNYKEQSLKAGKDIRFPKPKKKIDCNPLTFESEAGKRIMANKEILSTPLGKKFEDTMEKNAKKWQHI